nr:Isoniazid-inducible protein iniA [Actinomycetales bacterium]
MEVLVNRVGGLAQETNREDLVQRLLQTLERLRRPNVRVVIVGEFKQGKSKLINALVNAPVCPIDDDITTSVPTVVGYGQHPAATVISREGDEIFRQDVPIAQLANYVSEAGNPGNQLHLVAAEAQLPREILRDGLQLVDTPGVGGTDSGTALSTLSSLATASAVILVSDASQEYTDPEMQLLRHAMRVSPNVATVLAKTDLYPDWREVAEIDRGHLRDIGELPLFAVSSDLRLRAAQDQDSSLNEESGFPALVAHLRAEITGHADLISRRSAIHDLNFVVDQMNLASRSELAALQNPEDTPRLLADLERAKDRAEDFRGRSSKWNVRLGDGITDLIADMEHDLRDRLRRVQREAEQAIDEGDPGPIWEQIAHWVDERVADAVSETFVWTEERSRWLTEEVAELFLAEETQLPVIQVGDTEGLLDPVEPLPGFEPGHLSAGEKIYIGVRGSYGGVLMVGLATGLIGLSLINPLSLLAGVLVGRRAYREDMTNRLGRRRFEAKNIVRRYIDEVTFQVAKVLRDRLRVVQRTDRDHFGAIADEMHRSLTEAVHASKQAAGTFQADHQQRIAQLQAHIGQLERLRAELPALPPAQVRDVVRR